MSKKKRKKIASLGTADALPPSLEVQRGAQALFFIAIAFVAAREGIGGLHDPERSYANWALAVAGAFVGLIRRKDARFTDELCLSRSSRSRGGVTIAIVACVALAFAGAGNREHGLFATSVGEAALIGCLVFAGAMLAWGGTASATRTLLGRSALSVIAGAIVFTMAFFTGNLYADAAVLVAAIAATITTQRTRSIGFASIVFAYGAGGIPAAIVTSVLCIAISAARTSS